MAESGMAGAGGASATRWRLAFEELVPDVSVVMGVKAVFGRVSSRVMCFGARGGPDQHGRFYQAAKTTAERATAGQRLLIAIGGGAEVPPEVERRVVNVVSVSGVYGMTDAFVADPEVRARLRRWPTAVALRDVWEFEDAPHVINDLGFPDGRILENAFDQVIRPENRLERLVAALKGRTLVLKDLPPIFGFHDPGRLVLAAAHLPRKVSAEEGKRLATEATRLERDRGLAAEVKDRNRAANGGKLACEGCEFTDEDAALFDAHHLVPLAVEARTSTLSDFAVLCPTCHRIAHRCGDSQACPLPVAGLREWWRVRTNAAA